MTKDVNELYKSEASNLFDLSSLHNGSVGFRIPEYQRKYEWSRVDIERLYTGSLNGLFRLASSEDPNSLTFLGTLILVKEERTEQDFKGESLAIIDGQQRLTTLALFACALCERLREQLSETDLDSLDIATQDWLSEKVRDIGLALSTCSVGTQMTDYVNRYPFPRIVRHVDARGRKPSTSEYRSPIATFLDSFSKYLTSDDILIDLQRWQNSVHSDRSASANFVENFKIIQRLIRELDNPDWYEEHDCEIFDISRIKSPQCRDLLEKLPDEPEKLEVIRIIERVVDTDAVHPLLRTLMFSAYFCNCIVMTRVTTEDEGASFDIFDSLNTTGQPLTALETLKPRVMSLARQRRLPFNGSSAERSFTTIEEELQKGSEGRPGSKNTATKQLIVTFGLYLEGRRVGLDLSSQRQYLRNAFDRAANVAADEEFLRSLADLAMFRRAYWLRLENNQNPSIYHGDDTFDDVRLFVSFLSDMNTSLFLPILCRYWSTELKMEGDVEFMETLKALVSFIVLRRGWTGRTDGLDSDLRNVMVPDNNGESAKRLGLCAGLAVDRPRLPTSELKKGLLQFLKRKNVPLDKNEWVKGVAKQPLYQFSQPLVRFMIFAAAHHSIVSETKPGSWRREGIIEATHDSKYLDHSTWNRDEYSTVEHVAPNKGQTTNWPTELYQDSRLLDTLGNLVLLPPRENSAIGAAPWEKKRLFYLAITESQREDQLRRFDEARNSGIDFGSRTRNLISEGKCLSLLGPLRTVDEWSDNLVRERSANIAGLCFDTIRPWLDS